MKDLSKLHLCRYVEVGKGLVGTTKYDIIYSNILTCCSEMFIIITDVLIGLA